MNKQPKVRDTDGAPDSVTNDIALLVEAIADAFRGLTSSAHIESRWSRLRECGRPFGPGC